MTKVMSSFPVHGEMCSIKHYVTSRRFSPVSSTTKTDRHGLAEILLKVALNTLQKPKEMSQGQQSNQKIVEISYTPSTNIHDRSHSWRSRCTSILSAEIKLVLVTQICLHHFH
jgi:hypothetical protein